MTVLRTPHHHLVVSAVLILLAVGLPAQNALRDFDADPLFQTPPGFTTRSGLFWITPDVNGPGGRLLTSGPATQFHRVTLDFSRSDAQAVEVRARHRAGNGGLQSLGVLAGYDPATTTHFLLHLSNNSPRGAGFDRALLYWFDGATYNQVGTRSLRLFTFPRFVARLRLQWARRGGLSHLEASLDLDDDGTVEERWRAITPLGAGRSGEVGVSAFQDSSCDDFRWYRATLGPPNAALAAGGRATFDGQGLPNAAVVGGLALSANQGLFVQPGLRVPLDPDPLFLASVSVPTPFPGLRTSADGTGAFSLGLDVPPGLTGTAVHVAALSLASPVPWVTPPARVVLP